MPRKLPRCPCGCYVLQYARTISHICQAGDPWPAKNAQPQSESNRVRATTLRAEGMTLREVGVELGLTGERARQLIETSGTPLCPKCKRPSDRVESPKGRVPQCSLCYAAMMANRPSKAARRTGYRSNPTAHKRSYIVRLIKAGLTTQEIAERMGVPYRSIWQRINKMRQAGKDLPVAYGGKGPKRPAHKGEQDGSS